MTAAATQGHWDGLVLGASLATLDGIHGYCGISDGALGWRDGLITYVGPRADLPAEPVELAHTLIEADAKLRAEG